VQDSLQQGSLPLYAKHVGNNGGLPYPQGRAVIGLQGLATKGGRKPLGFGVQILKRKGWSPGLRLALQTAASLWHCVPIRSRGRVALITGAAAWPEDLATGERPGCKVPWGTCTQEVLSPGLGPERECCSCNTAPLQVLFQLDRKTQMLTSTIDPDHATHVVDSIGYLATPPRLPYGRLF
jgi:hypothetical protein